jgi:hypothetical protein
VSHQINFKIKIAEIKFQIFIGNNKKEERKNIGFFHFFADLICLFGSHKCSSAVQN